MKLFQRALGDGKIPTRTIRIARRGSQMQQKLSEETHKEAKKQLEQPVSDKDGQWMYIVPEPGFCIKCSTTKEERSLSTSVNTNELQNQFTGARRTRRRRDQV